MPSHTERSRIRRGAKRACEDAEIIADILRNNFLCHVSFVVNGEARLIPTAYVYNEGALYLHGNTNNGMLRALFGQTACIAVTELNGLVLARSGLHHSVNYRSVVLFARGEEVAANEKAAQLDALIDSLVPGRSPVIRPHLQKELDATLVVRLLVDEVSAKVRQGPPVDAEADYASDIWAGVVSLKTVASGVEPCPRLPAGTEVPEHLQRFLSQQGLESLSTCEAETVS